jgi:septal ring factor EnvC (AmiA/AmiB activator)
LHLLVVLLAPYYFKKTPFLEIRKQINNLGGQTIKRLGMQLLPEEIRVKKATLKKVAATVCVILLISASVYYLYQSVILPRSQLIDQIAFLRNEIKNRTFEKEQLGKQVTDLQVQISNLTQIVNPEFTDETQLNSEINALTIQLDNANQAIAGLNNELLEANATIERLQREINKAP